MQHMIEHRRGEGGFTLIELLIVIIILGVLTGIAIFAVGPFQDKAEEECVQVENKIKGVADSAKNAGLVASASELTGDLQCIDVLPQPPTNASSNFAFLELSAQPQPGQTIVAISGHRATNVAAPTICNLATLPANEASAPPCPGMAPGWTNWSTLNSSLGNGSWARGIAVFTKVAGQNEPTIIRVDWGAVSAGFSKSLVVLVLNRRFTDVQVSPGNHSGTTNVTSLTLGSTSGQPRSGVVIAGLAMRGGPCASPGFGCGVWGGVPGLENASGQDSSIFTGAAWASTTSGTGPFEASATWSVARPAIGFTAILQR